MRGPNWVVLIVWTVIIYNRHTTRTNVFLNTSRQGILLKRTPWRISEPRSELGPYRPWLPSDRESSTRGYLRWSHFWIREGARVRSHSIPLPPPVRPCWYPISLVSMLLHSSIWIWWLIEAWPDSRHIGNCMNDCEISGRKSVSMTLIRRLNMSNMSANKAKYFI